MRKISTDTIELRKLMVEKGYLTISKLSKDSGIDRNTLSKILKEKKQPSSTVMYRLSDVLQMTDTQAGEIFFSEKLT